MAIVKNLVALVEEGRIDVVAMLFKNIWGDEKGRFALFDRPAFIGEIALCWRARSILNSKGSPEHAYTWFVWRRNCGTAWRRRSGSANPKRSPQRTRPPRARLHDAEGPGPLQRRSRRDP